ncbi:charged multivesicular body protein 7-like [Clytia hemisphaerica]|uniref:charged multivesicular body protein 7-like n=1 Tax=Clytia hemisphaerica TaxID=252671 RepID=UPI0034D5FF70
MDDDQKYKLPSIDEERENFLYSPFPSEKSINPKHWDSKLNFWSKEVVESCNIQDEICVDCRRLQEVFKSERTARSPRGLQIVVSSLYQSGKLILKTDVTDLSPDLTWGQWGVSVSYKTTSWLWRKYVSGINESTEFVLKELLEELSEELLITHYKSVQYEKTDYVVPWNVLKTYKLKNKVISEDTLICLVGHLKNQGKCKIGISEDNEKIVKFKQKSQSKVDPVTSFDFETVKLKRAIAKLTLDSKSIEKDLQQLKKHAQTLVKTNDRIQAKKVLAQRHKLEKKLRTNQNALFTMKDHLGMVQETETTKLITDAFNSSATLLNQTYKKQGLTVEHIESVIDKAAEANEMAREVSDALSGGMKEVLVV